jgi:hypothetical protein
MKQPTKKPQLTQTPIEALLSKLGFSPDNVVQVASENPLLFRDAIDFRQQCMRERSRSKMNWERTQAEQGLDLRATYRANGEKLTEDYLKSLLVLDSKVVAAAEEFAKADEAEEYSKLVVEAVRMQRDCLKIVADLTWNEVGIQKAVEANADKMRETRSRLNAKYPGQLEP